MVFSITRDMPGVAATTRRRLVGTSTKMYFDYGRSVTYAQHVAELCNNHHSFPLVNPSGDQLLDIFVIPDFVSITRVNEELQRSTSEIWTGAQDTHDEDSGAYTGEVSAKSLAQVGCRIVEIGHAERRRLFGETDEWVVRKAIAIHRNGMIPLVCVGEAEEGTICEAALACFHQIEGVLRALPDADNVVAYEPVWAIGAAQPASPEYIAGVVSELRVRCLSTFRRSDGSLRIIYGGAAGPGLFQAISAHVDGLFLGRMAHRPEAFIDTILEVAGA